MTDLKMIADSIRQFIELNADNIPTAAQFCLDNSRDMFNSLNLTREQKDEIHDKYPAIYWLMTTGLTAGFLSNKDMMDLKNEIAAIRNG